jgi:spore coat polysaccharide biosynthesis protein SpsF (cytidylyltransferase family)
VTRFFYKNLIKFNYVLVGTKHVNYDYNKFKFSVDTVEDLAEMKKIYSKMVMKSYLHTVDDLINLKLEF